MRRRRVTPRVYSSASRWPRFWLVVGILHGLRVASSPARLEFGVFAIVLFLFVSLVGLVILAIERYFGMLEKTQELGVLGVLGASLTYVSGLLLLETLAICVPASAAGIGATFLMRWGAAMAFPKLLRIDVVYLWWPIAFGIAALGSVVGAVIGARKALRDGVVQALSYEP